MGLNLIALSAANVENTQAMQAVVRIIPIQDQAREDLKYWLSRPIAERIAAVEQLRQDHDAFMRATQKDTPDAEPRVQRVCRIVQRTRR
jgi:hypothetical protein